MRSCKMKQGPVTKSIDALSVRVRFGEVIEEAVQENTRFLVSRRGKPKVVILSVEDYVKNIIKQPELLTRVQLSAKAAGVDKMTEEQISAEITSYRSKTKRPKK